MGAKILRPISKWLSALALAYNRPIRLEGPVFFWEAYKPDGYRWLHTSSPGSVGLTRKAKEVHL